MPLDDEEKAELLRLRRENAELRHLIHVVPVAILVKDRDSRFLYVNRAGAVGYARPPEELVGVLQQELLPPDEETRRYLAQDREVIDSGVVAPNTRIHFAGADGKDRFLEVTKTPIVYQGTPAVMVVVWDLSQIQQVMQERTVLEKKMGESQRLESLGVLAGGIAHDFNNLLVGVLANADLARQAVGPDSDAARHVDRLKGAGLRLAELSKQMLAYSGRGPFTTKVLDVSQVVSEMLELVQASIAKNVRLEVELGEALAAVEADPAQLRQVVMNLVTNAAEALGTLSGCVEIRTCAEHFDPPEVPGLTLGAELEPGAYIRLSVADDGCGMDEDTRKRLFDPFFTTKASGRGLGLASVLGVVRAHQGALRVRSTPYEGTTFDVWLPTTEQVAVVSAQSVPELAVIQPGRRVLVVDDESVVREATAELLKARGFEVWGAEDGTQALETVQREPSFDAVLLDMSMPGPTVTQTHARIRQLDAQVPILLTSGYSDQAVLRDLLQRDSTVFLEKPYGADELVNQLRALLR